MQKNDHCIGNSILMFDLNM